jgi:phage repressor protein C with HTH and peptisase S24 domain
MIILRRVEGVSMAPAFPHGRLVIGWRWRRPQVGDVVIVRHHRVELIKRVDKLEGGRVYLLGDNPEESTDSRHYGWLPVAAVLAVVVKRRTR